jgi:hypothetical protein
MARPATHRALQRFQSIDLAFDLAIAPDFSDGVADGGGILAKFDGELAHAMDPRTQRIDEPRVELTRISCSATTAFSASISCFQFSNVRAARTCRPVIIHDHLRQVSAQPGN